MSPRTLALLLLPLSLAAIAASAEAMNADEVALVSRSAERGSGASAVLLAVAYLNGDGGLARDAAAAAHWFEMAALQGNGYAEEKLGDLYAQGLGVERNARLAADWREKAANRGLASAQLKLGKMYLEGQGVAMDQAKARHWIERAAIEGNAEAQYLMGRMYHAGTEVKADPGLARSWFEKAAQQGYESAIHLLHLIESLGYQLEEGWYHRLPQLHQLAEDGDTEAQYQLAQRYEQGVGGVKKDDQAALRWYRRAAAGGHPTAKNALEEILARRNKNE